MENIENNFVDEYVGATKYFLCQGEKLWFIPEIMRLSSDTMRIMLEGEFLEKDKREIAIPDEELVPMIHILNSLTPRLPLREIDEDNIEVVIPIAHKYFILPIMEKCRIVLLQKFTSDPSRAFLAFCLGVKYRFTEVITESIPLMLFSQNEGLMQKLEQMDIARLMPKSLCLWMATSFWFCNSSDYLQSKEYSDIGIKMEEYDSEDTLECDACWNLASLSLRQPVLNLACSEYDPAANGYDTRDPYDMEIIFPVSNKELGQMLTASRSPRFRCRCCEFIYCLEHCQDDKCTNLKEVIINKLPKMPDDWFQEP